MPMLRPGPNKPARYRLPCSGGNRTAGRAATSTFRLRKAGIDRSSATGGRGRHPTLQGGFNVPARSRQRGTAAQSVFSERRFLSMRAVLTFIVAPTKEEDHERTGPIVDQRPALFGCRYRREGQERAPWRAARGRPDGLPAVPQIHAPQSEAFQVDEPGPVRSFQRPCLGDALFGAVPERLRFVARGPAAVPAVWVEDARPSRVWGHGRSGSDDRTAGPGLCD